MRLRKLDLARYGCFTDFALDFGTRDAGKPDFHLVYGPNESGKSTLFSAFLDLLFGIEKRSQYGFQHDYRSLRIAAGFDCARESFDIVRIKRDSMSLLDADDRPVPEALLSSPLGALDRAAYTTMFSLDDDSLESGGESILQSEGDLGRLLYSATSGLSHLSHELDRIRDETDAFYRPGARATDLNRLKEDLKALKAAQQERDTNARHYADLQRAADEAKTRHDEAVAARDATRLRLGEVQRLLRALPLWAELQTLTGSLAPLEDLPTAPPGWHEEAQQLSQEAAANAAEVRGAEIGIAELRGALEDLTLDGDVLERAERIERLQAEEARFRGAEDIPAREAERAGILGEIAGVLKQLGRAPDEDPRDLLLPAATKGTLGDLIEAASGLDSRLETAGREAASAKDALAMAEAGLAALGAPLAVGGLERILRRLRGQEIESRLALAETRCREIEADIDSRLAALHPWQGDLPDLAALTLPGKGRVEAWRRSLVELGEEQRLAAQRAQALSEDCESRRAEIAAIKAGGSVIDDALAAAARQARDAAWQQHRESLTGPAGDLLGTAESFERAMAEDDRLVGLRSQQTAELARLREAELALVRSAAALAKIEGTRKAAATAESELRKDLADALGQSALPPDLLPEDLLAWMALRDAALQRRGALEAAASERAAAREARDAACDELAAALTAVGETPAAPYRLPALMERAEELLQTAAQREAKAATARDKLQACKLDLQRRERDAAEAEDLHRRWQEEWAAALEGCWLGASQGLRKVAEVREILKTLDGLPLLIDREQELSRRIRAMAEDRARFLAAVGGLADELALDFEAARVLEVSADLKQRLTAAQQQADRRQDKLKQVEGVEERLRKARSAWAEIDLRRAEMADLFGVESFSELLDRLRSAEEKAKLQERRSACETALLAALTLPSLAAAEAACAALGDGAALREEEVALESRLESEDAAATQLYHERHTAEAAVAAVGGDAAVARLEEERRTLLLEMQDQAGRYLRLKVGAAAAERGLQIYRDRHRSAMMTRAAEAFCEITLGRFTKLTTVPGKNGEVLVGIRANGASLLASEMSKGTCFQLYLALRIAGYFEYAQHRETLPFLADDIMETFDDERSAACFRLFSGMAEKGQVIYLTHHAHMRDIAARVCGDAVQLHELPASY